MSVIKVYFACLLSIILFVLGSALKAASSAVEVALWLAVRIAVIFGALVVICTLYEYFRIGFMHDEVMIYIIQLVIILIVAVPVLGVIFTFSGMLISLAVSAIRFMLRSPIDMCERGYASCLSVMMKAAGR